MIRRMQEEEKRKTKKEKRREKREKKKRRERVEKRKAIVKKFFVVLAILGVLAGSAYLWYRSKTASSKYDALAQCLTDKGVKMFGAYWCPHCQEQKKIFGNAWRYIKYIECSLPNAAGQSKKCNDAGIESYPTWEFADGERMTGEIALKKLAEKAHCLDKLPQF